MKYEVYKVRSGKRKGEFRFRLIADNSRVIIPPESYHNEQDLRDTIELIKGSGDALVIKVER